GPSAQGTQRRRGTGGLVGRRLHREEEELAARRRSMASDVSSAPRARFGLAPKLFAVLLLLGALAVLITGVLGYLLASEALEQSIYSQLTAARQTKSHQVENYFRSIRNDVSLLAGSKMVVDAMVGLRDAVDELDRTTLPEDVRRRVDRWYDDKY